MLLRTQQAKLAVYGRQHEDHATRRSVRAWNRCTELEMTAAVASGIAGQRAQVLPLPADLAEDRRTVETTFDG